jgi:hypothetical protein
MMAEGGSTQKAVNMGAAASVPPSPLFMDGEEAPKETVVHLKGLPDASELIPQDPLL